MQAGRFTETLKQIDASKHQLDLDFEIAYCHYRLNDPRKALAVLEGVANPQVLDIFINRSRDINFRLSTAT